MVLLLLVEEAELEPREAAWTVSRCLRLDRC